MDRHAVMLVIALIMGVVIAILIHNRHRIARWALRREVRRLLRTRAFGSLVVAFYSGLLILLGIGRVDLVWMLSLVYVVWAMFIDLFLKRIERYVVHRRALQVQKIWSTLSRSVGTSGARAPYGNAPQPTNLVDLREALESINADERLREHAERFMDLLRSLHGAKRANLPPELHALLAEHEAEVEEEEGRGKALRAIEDERCQQAHDAYMGR